MAFFQDSFANSTAGTLVTAGGYVPGLIGGGAGSGSWTSVTSTLVIDSTGVRARGNVTGENDVLASVVEPSTECDVEVDAFNLASGTLNGGNFGDAHDADIYGVMSHSDGTLANSYGAYLTSSGQTYTVNLFKGTTSKLAGVGGIPGVSGETYHVKLQIRKNSGTPANLDLTLFVSRASDGKYWWNNAGSWSWNTAATAVGTWTDTAALAKGKVGCRYYGYNNDTSGGLHLANFKATDAGAGLGGVATAVSSAAGNHLYLDGSNGSSAPSGGTAPYTYQWHRSTTAGFTPGGGDAIGGATANTYNDTTASESVAYFYICVVTDSAGSPATANSPVVTGVRTRRDFQVGFVGDSIYANTPTGGDPPPTTFANLLKYRGGHAYGATVSNQAIAGTKTADWISGSTDLVAAKAAFVTAFGTPDRSTNPVYVFIRLGANDGLAAVSAGTYLTNLTSAVNDLVTAGYYVILNYPYYGTGSYGGAVDVAVQSYQAQIDSLVNGTTIYAGDHRIWDLTAGAFGASFRQDDVHPTKNGAQLLAEEDVDSLLAVTFASGSGPILARAFTGF